LEDKKKRPKTAPDRPESPNMKQVSFRKEKTKETKKKTIKYGIMNESDRRLLNKINTNNLSIRGNSPQNRLF